MKSAHSDIRHNCRACHGMLELVIDLGPQPPSNALLKTYEEESRSYPLRAARCVECGLMQVDYDVSPRELFGDYVYFSSGSKDWLKHCRDYVIHIKRKLSLGATSHVVEIGSNDGCLLKNFIDLGITESVQGIDPSYTVAEVANAAGVPTSVDHFGTHLNGHWQKADLIIANNVLAHVPYIDDFVAAMAALLKSDGTITIEFPWVLNLIQQCQFDTIYHEHYSYLSLMALEPLFKRFGLKVWDVEMLTTHGGSLRLYVGKEAWVDVGPNVEKVRAAEIVGGLRDGFTYDLFRAKANKIRRDFLTYTLDHSLVGYGAAAKGNTFLNFCGINKGTIPYVADVTPAKQDKFLPGSRIPVVSEAALIAQRPPYVLILPWNWKDEIVRKLSPEMRKWRGRFVTAIPKLEVVTP